MPAPRTRPARPELIVAALAIAAGVVLRLLFLTTRPYGVDADQALVLLFGHDTWAAGKIALFQSEMTRFESLSSYFFLASWKLLGSARWLSVAIAFAEIALLFAVVRRESSARAAWFAAAILACSPWHWFYSRITGPCVGPGLVLLAYWWWRSSPRRIAPLVFGWFYYGAIRFAWLWELLRGKPRRARVLGVAAALVVALYVVFGVSFAEVARRGGYNWPSGAEAVATRATSWLSLWFAPPAEALTLDRPEMVVDPVTLGFTRLLGAQPATSWAGALSLIALIAVVAARADFRRRLKEPLRFAGLGALMLILSPTTSHGLALLPFLAWLAAEALALAPAKFAAAALAVVAIDGARASSGMLRALGEKGAVEGVFEDRWREAADEVAAKDPDRQVIFVADQALFSARFEALDREDWIAVHAMDPHEFAVLLNRSDIGRKRVFVFDRFVPPLPPHREGEFLQGRQRLRDLENMIRERHALTEEKTLVRDGKPLVKILRD